MSNAGEIPRREEMIGYLVRCAYPNILAQYGSSATAFRDELKDQPLQVIIAMYESAVFKRQVAVEKRLKKRGIVIKKEEPF